MREGIIDPRRSGHSENSVTFIYARFQQSPRSYYDLSPVLIGFCFGVFKTHIVKADTKTCANINYLIQWVIFFIHCPSISIIPLHPCKKQTKTKKFTNSQGDEREERAGVFV